MAQVTVCKDKFINSQSLLEAVLESRDSNLKGGVWVFIEEDSFGNILPVSFELLGKGMELKVCESQKLCAIYPTSAGRERAIELIAAGADIVFLIPDEIFRDKLADPFCDAIFPLIKEKDPEILLFGATFFGRSLAPAVAARAGVGLTADCTELDIDKTTGLMMQTRPAFGGNLMATIIAENSRPQMATVRPGVMKASVPDLKRKGEIIEIDTASLKLKSRVTLIEKKVADFKRHELDSPIIISAGRGIGSQKNMALVRALAEKTGGSVGVSRPLVDIGWCTQPHQIGQTGHAVSPRLLIACGISGAVQHLAGIAGAKTIVAINTDPDAPIFSIAHYKVVGDCIEILNELLKSF